MLILITPTLIILFLLLGILLFFRRSLLAGAIFLFASVLLNQYTQTFPLHPSYFFHSSSREHNQIRLLSYNIKYDSDYLRRNTDSLSAMIAFFEGQNADILILPESRINSTNKSLRQRLEKIYPYHLDSGYSGNEYYVETYVFSRFPIHNVKQYGRHYIYELDIDINDNFTVKLLACHLESNQSHSSLRKGEGIISNIRKGYETRAKEAHIITDSLKDYRGPLIIAGDLNDISGSKTLNILQETLHLDDAWWKSGFGYGTTSFSKMLYLRLDHILFSSHFQSKNVIIPKVDFSDHYPIVTDLMIQQE